MTVINTIRYGETYLDPANRYRVIYYRNGVGVVTEGRKIVTILFQRVMKRWLRF